MKVYTTLKEISDALSKGVKLCQLNTGNGNYVSGDHFNPIVYFYTNAQFNRCFAHLDNGADVEHPITIFDLVYSNGWVNYDEFLNEKRDSEPKELSIEEIEKKLGYKIKIVNKENKS